MILGSRFTAKSLVLNSPLRHFYLAEHANPTDGNSKEPFQYYQRLSGSTSQHFSIAIDVDIAHQQWRLFSLNGTDAANQWLSYDSKQREFGQLPKVRSFPKPAEELLAAGEFTPVNATERIMLLPELDLAILGMWGFLHKFEQEPFLRVVNITDYTEAMHHDKKLRIVEDGWTWTPHPREILRTASFGHGRQDLTVCVRENSHVLDPSDVQAENREKSVGAPPRQDIWGIQTYQLVPFAIISSYRQRIKETGVRATTLAEARSLS